LIVTPDAAEGSKIGALVRDPTRTEVISVSGGTTAWINNKAVTEAIFQWLQQTF